MKCLRCRTLWPEAHTTRMIFHLLQQLGKNVKPFLGKIDEDAKKSTKISLREGFLKTLEKSTSMKTQLSQYRTSKSPWPKHWWPQETPHCHAPLWIKYSPQFWQVLIDPCHVTLERAMTPREMTISNFFYCENIADQVLESTRMKYMLKQGLLVRVSLGHQQGKNWR